MGGSRDGAGGGSVPLAGVLEVVAGQLGGPGNLDGIGTGARFNNIGATVFDPDDDRVFVLDTQILRAIDVQTKRVTTLGPVADPYLFYQRGALYSYQLDYEDAAGNYVPLTLHRLSITDGHLEATTAANPSPPVRAYSQLLAWPTGDTVFQVSDDGRLARLDPATGNVTTVPVTGFPSAVQLSASVMVGPTTILVAVESPPGQPPLIAEVLSIDIPSAKATVVATVPSDQFIGALDPLGQFAMVLDSMGRFLPAIPLGSGAVPAFSTISTLVGVSQGQLLIVGFTGIEAWDRVAPAPTKWAGLDLPVGPENLGPGAGVTFPQAPLAISTTGPKAYVTWALGDGLAVIDPATGAVSALTQSLAANAAAVLPAAEGGDLYVTERDDCAVWQLPADPNAAAIALLPERESCLYRSASPMSPITVDFVKSALALFDGSLLFMSDGANGIFQIDPVARTWTSHVFYDRLGAGELDSIGMTGAAIGSDGLLYAVDGASLYRIDHGLGSATVIGPGGTSLAADKAGHLYTTDADSVWRLDIATGRRQRVIGAPGSVGVAPGALPGSLSHPQGLAVTDAGDLLVGNTGEYVVLRARFQ